MVKKSAINIQTYKETLSILSQYDIITFDVFDLHPVKYST